MSSVGPDPNHKKVHGIEVAYSAVNAATVARDATKRVGHVGG